MSDRWEFIPDDVIEAAKHDALKSARKVLSTLQGPGSPSYDEITNTILRAFEAVVDAISRAESDFRSRHPGKEYYDPNGYIDAHHIVATALAFRDQPSFMPDPLSLGGAFILNFANVCKALDSFNNVADSLRSGEMYGAEHAKQLLSNFRYKK